MGDSKNFISMVMHVKTMKAVTWFTSMDPNLTKSFQGAQAKFSG